MTDKELIKQEIERRYNCEKCYPLDREANVAAAVLQELLLFIDSLPEEPKCIYNRTLDERKKFCKYCSAACDVRIEEEPASEDKSEKELAETYLAVFDKKHPILPTLKGKQKADFKNFLNKCQQEFGLKEFGIHPTQSKLFEKLTLLWATWGAEHLEGLGKSNQDELDKEYASKDLEEEINRIDDWCPVDLKYIKEIAHHFVEWQKKRDFPAKDITDSAMYWCGYKDCKEEMMKDAVEGEIVYKIGNAEIAPTDVRYKVMSDRVYIPNVKLGDKMKIIICKTEQQ